MVAEVPAPEAALLAGLSWERVRSATVQDPLRVLVSACLVGHTTGWDGLAYTAPLVVRLTRCERVAALPFCPEDGVLGTPRALTTIHRGDGRDVVAGRARVWDTDGQDRTEAIVRGAQAMVDTARRRGAELAVLMNVSDSCGLHVIYRGEASERAYRRGVGVAAAMLLAAGVPVVSQRDERTLSRLLAALDPAYCAPEDAQDFVEIDWYRETVGERDDRGR